MSPRSPSGTVCPSSVGISSANVVHDSRARIPRLQGSVPARPTTAPAGQLHGDKGYDHDHLRRWSRGCGIAPRIARRGMGPGQRLAHTAGRSNTPWPGSRDADAPAPSLLHTETSSGSSGMTCWRRLWDWNEAGVWQQLHEALLAELNAGRKLGWSRSVVDSFQARALEGGSLPLLDAVPPIRGRVGRPRRRAVRLYADCGYDHDRYRKQVRAGVIVPAVARRDTGTDPGSASTGGWSSGPLPGSTASADCACAGNDEQTSTKHSSDSPAA